MKKVEHQFFEDDGLDYEDMLNDFDSFCDQFENRAAKAYNGGDQNNDTIPEIIVVNSIGEIHVFSISGNYYNHFPISNEYAFSSSPLVLDIDSDNDLELIAGTTNSIINIDIKEHGVVENYWNVYGNNFSRNSYK